MTTVRDVLIYEALENDRKYREEKKKKKLSDKVKVKIEKGKIQSRKKTEKIIAQNKSVKARIASGVIVANKTRKLSQGKIISKRKNTGEKQLFETIRNIRPHYCILCKKHIIEAKSRCFAHLLAKGMYPKYRLYEANIALVCSIECHKCIDNIVVGYNKNIVQYLLDQGSDIYNIMKMIGK